MLLTPVGYAPHASPFVSRGDWLNLPVAQDEASGADIARGKESGKVEPSAYTKVQASDYVKA